MKTKITFLFMLLMGLTANSQVTPVLQHNDLTAGVEYDSNDYDMAYYNNEVYFSNAADGKIFKISVLTQNATPVDVLTGLNYPTGLSVVGNELYFLEAFTGDLNPGTGKLSKLNLTQQNPVATPIMSGLSFPIEIKATAENIYITEHYLDANEDLDYSEIAVVNLSGTPTKTVLAGQLDSVDDIDVKDNFLYLIEWNEVVDETYIKRLDISNGTPGTPTVFYTDVDEQYFYRGAIDGNKMYLNNDSSPREILEIDLTAANPTLTPVATSFLFNGNTANPGELIAAPGNILYVFAESYDGNSSTYILYKVDTNPLSVDDLEKATVKVYPNPTTDYIIVSDIEKTGYGIYTLEGKMVQAGVTSNDEKIAVSHLNTGVYFLKLENGTAYKIIKK